MLCRDSKTCVRRIDKGSERVKEREQHFMSLTTLKTKSGNMGASERVKEGKKKSKSLTTLKTKSENMGEKE